jgi:putative transposase
MAATEYNLVIFTYNLLLMPFVNVYLHLVWTTKNKYPYFNTPELRREVWEHIFHNARDKGIHLDFVGGYDDHCHCLVSLNATQVIWNVVKMIKGESSNWINKNMLTEKKFDWQDEYYAVSVGQDGIERVRNYIRGQEEHHAKKRFEEEMRDFEWDADL